MILPAPQHPKAVIFVDGQNLFHAVKKAFGYTFPNSDITKLSQAICSARGWNVQEIRFYTGIPDISVKPLWHDFWIRKLTAMGQTGIKVFKRTLRYHNQTVTLPNGVQGSVLVGLIQEYSLLCIFILLRDGPTGRTGWRHRDPV